MARLEWGQEPPFYDLGVDHGVLYLDDSAVPWNGLVSVVERHTGETYADHYFDGTRFYISHTTGDYEADISAYTYPEVFSEYNGFGERDIYRRFGFSYRTQNGNNNKIHLVYNVLVRDDVRSWKTVDANVDPSLFNWGISAASIEMPDTSPAAHLTMEAPRNSSVLDELEDILYGTDTTEPRLPDPAEVIELYESATILRIIHNGDGSYTAIGPDEMVRLLADGRFEIDAPTVFLIDQGIFQVNSY